MRCNSCNGSGKMYGLGMVKVDCVPCDGTGSVMSEEEEIRFLRNKNPQAFDEAKENLKTADNNLSDEEAGRYLNSAIKSKRGRKKKIEG